MRDIILHNKVFEVFITENKIQKIVESIANNINTTKIKEPLFIAVLNGSFLFAADIMRKITLPNAEGEGNVINPIIDMGIFFKNNDSSDPDGTFRLTLQATMNLNDKKNVFYDENYTKNEDDTILVANVSNKISEPFVQVE